MRFLACLAAIAVLAATLSAEEYKGAKITKIGEKLLITLDVNGKEVQLTAYPFLKGYGVDGKELVGVGQGVRVFKEGNVLDLKTESMKLTGQPQIYISEARLVKGELQSLEVLRSLSTKNLPTKVTPKSKTSREGDPAKTFTVVKYEPRQAVVLRGADGKQITAKASLDKATDAEGQPLPDDQLLRVLKTGNVVELRLAESNRTTLIKEARLVSGELGPVDTKPAAAEPVEVTVHKGVVLKKFGMRGSAIEVDGKEVEIGNWSINSVFLDQKGEQLKSGPDILGANQGRSRGGSQARPQAA